MHICAITLTLTELFFHTRLCLVIHVSSYMCECMYLHICLYLCPKLKPMNVVPDWHDSCHIIRSKIINFQECLGSWF